MSRQSKTSPSRLVAIATSASLLAAGAAFATGGSISISSLPSLSLGASGLTQGLYASVWHVPPSPQLGGATGSYGIPATYNSPAITDVQNVESYIKSSGYYDSATGVTYTLPSPAETFVNTADTFAYNGGYYPTQYYLGADGSGATLYDGNPWYSSIVDQMGYIKVSSAGTYTFNMTHADDAGAVYIGGTGIVPSGNAGTGTQVVAASWNGTSIPSTDQNANVTFSSAGYYPIEVMNYQQSGGAGFNLSVANSAGKAASYYTTTSLASSVTPTPKAAAVPTSAPTPTDEWNFAKSTISGSAVSDIGTAGSAATAGAVIGSGTSVTNGALVTTSTANGNGMTIPASTFAKYTGSFSIAVTFDRSTTDPTNQWGSLMAFGDKGTGGSQDLIDLQPQRQDGTNLSSMIVQGDGVATMLVANNDKPTPAGQKIQEVLTYDASTQTASLYINGVLQMSGSILNTTSFSLAAVADNVGTSSSPLTPLDGLGGVDSYGDATTLASFYDLSIWNSALSAGQVAGLTSAPTPEPASLGILAAAALGGLALVSRRRAKT